MHVDLAAGTGKTIFVKRYLQFALPAAEWAIAFLTLSARTTARSTQEQVVTAVPSVHSFVHVTGRASLPSASLRFH
jgi:hypothetical protein